MSIVSVNIGGEIRQLSMKLNFMMKLGIELKVDPMKVGGEIEAICALNPLQALTIIIYCGLVAFQERKGNYNHGLTLAIVAEWVDDADYNEFSSVWEAFSDVMGIPRATAEQIKSKEKELKKKNLPRSKNLKNTL